MKNERPASGQDGGLHDELPQVGKPVVVEVNGCRCMAFRDPDGKWRDYFNGDELGGRVTVVKPDWPQT